MSNTAIHRILTDQTMPKYKDGTGNSDTHGGVVDCWNQIGVSGDSSCEELKTCFHCRNCGVFTNSGRSLFDRGIDNEYKTELTELISKEKESIEKGTVAFFGFRLGSEWLVIPTALFIEVSEMKIIRRMPYRPNPILKGLVNIRGELQLCVSLHHVLGLSESDPQDQKDQKDQEAQAHEGARRRLLVVEKDRTRWVFPVDQVLGLLRCMPANLEKTPVTISKSATPHIKAVLRQKMGLEIQGLPRTLAVETTDSKAWQAGVIDEELLFYQLGRSVQ
jgi:chemotaxis-related protein WspD